MRTFKQYKRIIDELADYEREYNNNNNISNENTYAFKPELYQQLITNRQYEDAYEYGSKFMRNDPEENKAFYMQLHNDRREGRKESYFYSQLQQDPDMMHQVEFYRNVFVNNGLSSIVNKKDNNNTYAEKFINAKKRIGSSVKKDGTIETEAIKLSVTFKPKGSSWFLKDWITGTDEDVDYLELFYSQSGLNEQQLKANGISVSKQDGNTTITFDKSNPIANKILYGLDFQDAYDVRYYGTTTSYNHVDNAPEIKGYNKDGDVIEYNHVLIERSKFDYITYDYISKALSDASTFKRMIDDAKYVNTKAEEFVSKEDGGYQGFAIPITKEEVKSKGIDEGIGVLDANGLEIYSNAYNENDDTTLRFVEQISEDDDDNRKVKLMNYIKANSDRMHCAYANYGDKIGMLITIDPYSITDNTAKTLGKDMDLKQGYHGKEVRVFIPDLYTDEANKAINNNSQVRAIRESNDMQKYGYSYKLYDDREIMYDGDGSFIYQDNYEKISQDNAISLIHKSQLMDDSKFLKYEYINNNNQIYDYTNFDNHAKQYAISAAMSLNPDIFQVANIDNNIVFVDKQGNKASINDIFNKKGSGTAVLYKYSQSMNYTTLKFYKDCFDVYMSIINDAKNYK